MLEIIKEINNALNFYIKPQTFPVAIRMCAGAEGVPARARLPRRDLGTPVPLCQGIAMARRYGWTVAIGREDQGCPHAHYVLGFIRGQSYEDGSSGEKLGLGEKEYLAQLAGNVSRLEYGKYFCMLAAPLDKATFEPHIILVYGNPAQVARLVQGYSAITGKAVTTPATGGVACGSFIARTMNTDECQVILAGAGDRYFALTQDHELAFAMPWSKATMIIEGLSKGHESGMHRYPTPSSIRFNGVLPRVYERWAESLLDEDKSV